MQECEVIASNIFFDDTSCKNTYKYLKLCYECMPDTVNAVDVLLEVGKRRRRGTSLKDILSRKRKEHQVDEKILADLWAHPTHIHE